MNVIKYFNRSGLLIFRDIIISLFSLFFGIIILVSTDFNINVSENIYAFLRLAYIWLIPVTIIVTSALILLINISVVWVRFAFRLLPDTSRGYIDSAEKISFHGMGIYIFKWLIRLAITSIVPWVIYLVILYINKSTNYFVTYDWLIFVYLSPYIVGMTIITFFINYYTFIIFLKRWAKNEWPWSAKANEWIQNQILWISIFSLVFIIGVLLLLHFYFHITDLFLFWKITLLIWSFLFLWVITIYFYDYFRNVYNKSNSTTNFIRINIFLFICILALSSFYNNYYPLIIYSIILIVFISTTGLSFLLNSIIEKLTNFYKNIFK